MRVHLPFTASQQACNPTIRRHESLGDSKSAWPLPEYYMLKKKCYFRSLLSLASVRLLESAVGIIFITTIILLSWQGAIVERQVKKITRIFIWANPTIIGTPKLERLIYFRLNPYFLSRFDDFFMPSMFFSLFANRFWHLRDLENVVRYVKMRSRLVKKNAKLNR